MKAYPSIETVFVRDETSRKLHFGQIRQPEVACINKWSVSEKVDGTNVRVVCTLNGVEIKGRTDNANLHPELIAHVTAIFPHAKIVDYFRCYRGKDLAPEWSVTFYGEGYGAGIQKGGIYNKQKRFRCFDLMLGEFWWVDDSEMRRVCGDLNIPTVPHLGHITTVPTTKSELEALIPWSYVGESENGNRVQAEGIVAKPEHVLLDRHGSRVMWKLTFREFRDG